MLSFVLILWTKLTNIRVIGMISRTPIRLTPHRGPLATPSTSAESSPTMSTPPSDISHCSAGSSPTLDVADLQHRIFALNPPTRHQTSSHIYRWQREVIQQSLLGRSAYLCLAFESLICSACELANALASIVTFCLLIWGILEWSSHVSRLRERPRSWISTSQFPLPLSTRALHCHINPSLCEPSDEHAAVLQFLSEQIEHANALASLSVGLGLPLRAFLEERRAAIPGVTVRHSDLPTPFLVQVDRLANMTESLDPSILDFTPGSFIGRSFTLALHELDDLVSGSMISRGPSVYADQQDAHLQAIYWRTTSNLLLEYSAARPRARRLLQQMRSLHQQLSSLVSGPYALESVEKKLNTRWWNGIVRDPAASVEDRIETFVSGLKTTLDNIHRFVAYLDWITEHLAQTTLKDVLQTSRRANFPSCTASLQGLFAQSKPLVPKKRCFCLHDYGVAPLTQPERINITVPGSPTVRAGR